MTCIKAALLIMLLHVLYQLHAEELTWQKHPNPITYVEQGSNAIMHWSYEIKNAIKFLSSRLLRENKEFASRHGSEVNYTIHIEGENQSFSIFGKDNITFIVHNAELSHRGKYCLIVTLKLNDKIKDRKEMCTNLSVYVLPRITYHTPQLSVKQGDSVKLQCNATGYPKPRVEWIHNDTNKIIANSSVTSLNITGKRSEGNYCCHVTNQFGKETKCTSVIVTEYKPLKTVLSSNKKCAIRNKVLKLRCRAKAFPFPDYFIMEIGNKQYNSSNGILNVNVTAATPDIAVSCIPWNKYGRGPMKKIILPVYDPPRFNMHTTKYYMTNSSIAMNCSATGNPKPKLKWTEGDTGKIVSTKAYYEVPYEKCANKTLTFYCHASNTLGSINSTENQVHVMTKANCSTSLLKGVKERETSDIVLYIVLGIGILALVITITICIICYCKKKERGDAVDKQSQKEEEIPMGDVEAQQPSENLTNQQLCKNVDLNRCYPEEV